jgi:glycosyltransferase involved in cell wall biosynthesis
MRNLAAKNKIVFITSSYYPSLGGVEKHVQRVAEILASKGREVKVFVRYKENYPKYQKINNVEIYRMPKKDGRPNINLWYLKNKKYFKDAVIHSHDYFPSVIKKLLKNNRWVHTFHGYEGYPLNPAAIESRKRVASSVDYTFCVGKFIEKWYGTKCDEVIWGAAEKPKKIKKPIKYDFIFFGRFEEDTGFEKYVEAFKIIKSKVPNATMVAVGWGSKANWAIQYSMKNRLGIVFKEPVKDVYPLISQSRVAFVSGYQAIIESSLMKRPIVAYYDTPIKKDYLKMHPMAVYLNIAKNAEEISINALSALESSKDLKTLFSWASKQNWESIENKYNKSYFNY